MQNSNAYYQWLGYYGAGWLSHAHVKARDESFLFSGSRNLSVNVINIEAYLSIFISYLSLFNTR
jgi:hypothetical protein